MTSRHADVTPVHEKKDKNDKTNYKPVGILTNISKMYEKLIYNQLYHCFDDIQSPTQCTQGTVCRSAYFSC